MNTVKREPTNIGCLLGVPLLFLLALVSIPYALATSIYLPVRERRFQTRLLAKDRFAAWPTVAERLAHGDGTFLVEHANKQSVRFWWCADDVAALAPAAPPGPESYDYIRPNPEHPFVSWCFARYTSPVSGSAVLTQPDFALPPGPVEESFLLSLFPHARIVFTILAHPAA